MCRCTASSMHKLHKCDLGSLMSHRLHEWRHPYHPASWSSKHICFHRFSNLMFHCILLILLVSDLLSMIFFDLFWKFAHQQFRVIASLLAWRTVDAQFGADIRSQNVLTFMAFRFKEILRMPYCRSNANRDGVASFKRPLFRMIVAIAAARSILHERAAFVTSWGSSERTLFCSFFFSRSFEVMSCPMEPASHFLWRVWRMETSGSMTCLVVLSVFLLLCVSEFVYLNFSLDFNRHNTWRQVQDEMQMLSAIGFLEVFMMFPVPIPFP